jgi:hypothetical protein
MKVIDSAAVADDGDPPDPDQLLRVRAAFVIASTGVVLGAILLASGDTDGARLAFLLLLWAVSLLPRTRTQRLVVGSGFLALIGLLLWQASRTRDEFGLPDTPSTVLMAGLAIASFVGAVACLVLARRWRHL